MEANTPSGVERNLPRTFTISRHREVAPEGPNASTNYLRTIPEGVDTDGAGGFFGKCDIPKIITIFKRRLSNACNGIGNRHILKFRLLRKKTLTSHDLEKGR
jgi:hypothetical protein